MKRQLLRISLEVGLVAVGLLVTAAVPYLASETPLSQYLLQLPRGWVSALVGAASAVPTVSALTWVLHARQRDSIPVGKCSGCRYDLRGSDDGTCPECGARNELP